MNADRRAGRRMDAFVPVENFPLTGKALVLLYSSHFFGALAQLGERMAGSHEVRGSIPLGSTREFDANPPDFNLAGSFFMLQLRCEVKVSVSAPAQHRGVLIRIDPFGG